MRTLVLCALLVGCTTTFNSQNGTDDGDTDEEAIEDTTTDSNGADEAEAPCVTYEDLDGDGYGGREIEGCSGVTQPGDCCDSDDRVHPGQPNFFSAPFECPTASWDYDCNGSNDLEITALVVCDDSDCPVGPVGWIEALPACGGVAEYGTCRWATYPMYFCAKHVSDSIVARCH